MKKEAKKDFAIWFLALAGFFAIFSTTISKNPVLPLFVKALGGGTSIIGIIAVFSPLAGVLFSFPAGILADKIGKKKVSLIAGFILLVSPLLYLFVTNPYYLIPIRFFHGLGTAILGPVAAAIIAEKYTKNKGEKLGIYSSSTLIGRTIAPLIGGFLISYFISFGGLVNYKIVYLVAFLLALPAFVLLLLSISHKEKNLDGVLSFKLFFRDIRDFFYNARLVSTSLVEMTTYFLFGVLETYLPIYMLSLGFPAYKIGLIFSIQILGLAILKPIFGKISDKIDRRYQIVFGLLITGIGISLIAFVSSFLGIMILSLIFGLGMSISTSATSPYIADLSKKREIGASMGAFSAMMDVGQTTGPLILGFIITSLSFKFGFLGCFILTLLSVGFFVYINFRKHEN
jgi:MFS family permease